MSREGKVVVALELIDRDRDRAIVEVTRRIAGPTAPLLLLHAHAVTKTAVLDFVKLESATEVNARVQAATDRLKEIAQHVSSPVTVDVALGFAAEVLIE